MENKIALVNYYNTEPFLFGLKELGTDFKLNRTTPSVCKALFESGQVDIALVPVVTLFENKDARIISDFGICCDDKVRTVVLFTNEPKEKIKTVYLDDHSRTSVQLLRVIVNNFWGYEPEYLRTDVKGIQLKDGEGVLMIGDKVFSNESRFKYCYDLGQEWKNYTSLPFVFAVWLGKKNGSPATKQKLNTIFEYGMTCIPQIIKKYKNENSIDLESYYMDNIHFNLGPLEHQAIRRFEEEIAIAHSKISV